MKESSRTRRKETTKKERKLKRRRKGGKRKLKGKERMMDTTIMDWRKTQGRKKRRKWKKGITQGQETTKQEIEGRVQGHVQVGNE